MTTSRKAENERKRRQWEQYLTDWAESGQTQVAYCREHELSRHQFQYWKKRLRPSAKPAFIELHWQSDQDHKKAHSPLRIIVGNGYQVAVERDFDPVALQQLVGVLSRL